MHNIEMMISCCFGGPPVKTCRSIKAHLKRLYILFLTIILTTCVTNVQSQFPTEKCQELLPNCTCDDYVKQIGILCSRMDYFDEFSSILTNDTVFPPNVSYEITLRSLNILPARSFKGLHIYRIYLDGEELSEVQKGAFDAVLELTKFHVLSSSIQVLPDFRQIRKSLAVLHLDNSRLVSLDGNGLQGLLLLSTLSLTNNSIQYVDSEVFEGTENIIIFDLSYNKLTYLPPHLLDKWKKLNKIVLSHNQLLNVDSLFAICHPRIIHLDFNNLTDVEQILHPGMWKVNTLYLSHNPLVKLSSTSFNHKIPKIGYLYLDHCDIAEFDVEYFKSLRSLVELDMSWNLIEVVPKQVIDFGNGMELSLAGNRIEEFGAEITFTVGRLFLQDNNLKSLGSTLWLSQPRQVSLARNRLQYIAQNDFKGMHNTSNIELQGNAIQRIDRFSFFTLRKDLNYLDLSVNKIESLNGSMRSLSQLIALNLSGNLLQMFEENEFMGLPELSELHLQNNRIIFFDMQLQQLSQLQFLDLRNNSLVNLVPNQLPKTLQYVYLKGNPFRCDCKFLSFLKWLNASSLPGTDVVPCTSRDDNVLPHAAKPCPGACTCSCSEFKGKYFMYLDCSDRNMSVLPDFLLEESNENTSLSQFLETRFDFEMTSQSQFFIHDQALGISLEHNRFQSFISVLVHPQLLQLHLAGNLLGTVSTSFLYSLDMLQDVTLSDNPWKCDCDAIPFRKWLLSRMSIVRDINRTLCSNDVKTPYLSGRVIWTLNDLDLCPTEVFWYLISFSIAVVLFLCSSGAVVCLKYQLEIKAWLYARGFKRLKEVDSDEDRPYDAFLAYAKEDREIMLEVVREVPKKQRTKFFIHDRDFEGGEDIDKNIRNGIRDSKKTVVFLSKHFLESHWCMFEFKIAYEMTYKDEINRIIIVTVGDLPETKRLREDIKRHMELKTYLTWESKHFWERFLYVLPVRKDIQDEERRMELHQLPECEGLLTN